jgi:urease accessory protein
MLEIKAKLKVPRGAYKLEIKDRLELAFAERSSRGVLVRLASGADVKLMLPAGEILRGGDLATASDGRVVEVVAAVEKLLQVEGAALAKVAYLLGSHHVPTEIGEGFLRVPADPGLEAALPQLGLKVSHVEQPFEPEVIHHGHGHDHGHDHDHDHGHDHDHHHGKKDAPAPNEARAFQKTAADLGGRRLAAASLAPCAVAPLPVHDGYAALRVTASAEDLSSMEISPESSAPSSTLTLV